MVLVKQDSCTSKNPTKSILIALHKTELWMEQRSQYKTKCTEFGRQEHRKQSWTHCQRNDSLNRTLITQALRTINSWGFIRLKSFCITKDTTEFITSSFLGVLWKFHTKHFDHNHYPLQLFPRKTIFACLYLKVWNNER